MDFLLPFLSHVRVKSTCNGTLFLQVARLCKSNVSHVCVRTTRVLVDLLRDHTSMPTHLLFYLSNSAYYLHFYKSAPPLSDSLRPAPPSPMHDLFIEQVGIESPASQATRQIVSLLQWPPHSQPATKWLSILRSRDSRPVRQLVDSLMDGKSLRHRAILHTVPSQAAMGLGRHVLGRWILAIHMRTVICMGIGIGKWEYNSHADMAF